MDVDVSSSTDTEPDKTEDETKAPKALLGSLRTVPRFDTAAVHIIHGKGKFREVDPENG